MAIIIPTAALIVVTLIILTVLARARPLYYYRNQGPKFNTNAPLSYAQKLIKSAMCIHTQKCTDIEFALI